MADSLVGASEEVTNTICHLCKRLGRYGAGEGFDIQETIKEARGRGGAIVEEGSRGDLLADNKSRVRLYSGETAYLTTSIGMSSVEPSLGIFVVLVESFTSCNELHGISWSNSDLATLVDLR